MQLHGRNRYRAGGARFWLVCSLSLLVAACGAFAPQATLTPTASTTPQVVATRLTAQLTGRLVLVGDCLRVQNSNVPGESLLLVFPPGFTGSVSKTTVLVSDFQDKKEFTWRLGDIVTLAGGNVPTLDPTLQELLPPDCQGPYWVVGGISASASPTPTVAPTRTPGPARSAAPTLTPYLNSILATQVVLARAGPGTVYDVVGQLQVGQTYPVVGQAGEWWELAPDQGHTAWVFKDLVTFSGDAQTLPVVPGPATPTAPP
jgi:Bacterial SH3 domain